MKKICSIWAKGILAHTLTSRKSFHEKYENFKNEKGQHDEINDPEKFHPRF